jgi:hypothetical protein
MKSLFRTLQWSLLFVAQAAAEDAPRFEVFGGYSLADANIATNVPNASPSHIMKAVSMSQPRLTSLDGSVLPQTSVGTSILA